VSGGLITIGNIHRFIGMKRLTRAVAVPTLRPSIETG